MESIPTVRKEACTIPPMSELEKKFNMQWADAAAIEILITRRIPAFLQCDSTYQNSQKYSDVEKIRIEGELAIQRAISAVLADYEQLLQQFTENPHFREWVTCAVFRSIIKSSRGSIMRS